MDEVCVKDEFPMDESEDPLAIGDPDPENIIYGVAVKKEPEEILPMDGVPFIDKVTFDEISIKPEKIDPFGSNDDNLTDVDSGQTPKLPTNDNVSEESIEKRLSNASSRSPNTNAVSPRSNIPGENLPNSDPGAGNIKDVQDVLNLNHGLASKLSGASNTGQPLAIMDEAHESPADFLCNVVADLNAPTLHDYIMMPLGMEDNHEEHSYDMEMSELGSSLNSGEHSPGSSCSSTSKTRTADPSRWVSVAAKKARNLGEEYVSPDGSVIVKARKMGPGCSFSCRYKCHDKLSELHRQEIFSQFWKMGTHSLHWDFISKHVKVMKKKTSTSSNDSRRQTSRIYYFRVNNEEIQVCKTMFTHTLGVWDQWIETAIRKSQASDGAEFPDMRGKHTTNSSRTYGAKPLTTATVINHVKMFKPVEGRDVTKKSEKQFLEEGLNVSTMHKMYLDWMTDREGKPATLRQYRDTFNANFNLSFFVPKKECSDCHNYNNASPEEKLSLEQGYQEHVKSTTQMKEVKAADAQEAKAKGNPHIGMVCFDVQKVLYTPQCRNPLLYYRHKLCVYNFAVCDVGAHAGYCFVWHEGIGRRTCHEVASFLLHYLEMKTAEGVTEFRLYGDDGYGLHKNKAVLSMLTVAATKFGVKIRLRFLERGHSQNETDNMHNLIEKRGKDYELYVPDDWIKVMESAKNWRNPQGEASKPYTVIEVTQDMIFDFSSLVEKLNLDVDFNGLQIPWAKVCEVNFDSSEPGCLAYKVELDGASTKVYTELAGQSIDYKNYSLVRAYSGALPIAQTKLDDLLAVCSGSIVPSRYHQFYRSLKGCAQLGLPEAVKEVEHREATTSGVLDDLSSDGEEPPKKKSVK